MNFDPISYAMGAKSAGGSSNIFGVNFYPQNPDYSGYMNHTLREIAEAYSAGKRIMFNVVTGENSATRVECTLAFSDSSEYPTFSAYMLYPDADIIIYAHTSYSDGWDDDSYATIIYSLNRVQ